MGDRAVYTVHLHSVLVYKNGIIIFLPIAVKFSPRVFCYQQHVTTFGSLL